MDVVVVFEGPLSGVDGLPANLRRALAADTGTQLGAGPHALVVSGVTDGWPQDVTGSAATAQAMQMGYSPIALLSGNQPLMTLGRVRAALTAARTFDLVLATDGAGRINLMALRQWHPCLDVGDVLEQVLPRSPARTLLLEPTLSVYHEADLAALQPGVLGPALSVALGL